MEHYKWCVWTLWIFLCFILVYLILCFIGWDWINLAKEGVEDRAAFFTLGMVMMGMTFWIPGIICDDIRRKLRSRGR